MSRLDEEFIMAVVRNSSGIDSGELDYSIKSDRFENLSFKDILKVKDVLIDLSTKCNERIAEMHTPKR
jgi:hypothetical protein